jgi:hypothetical protein
LLHLLGRVQGDVARARDGAALTRNPITCVVQRVLGQIDAAVSGRLCAHETTAKGQTLTGKDSAEAILEPLVLAEEVADLALADTDVTCGHIGVFSDVAVQLDHQRLAEPHDLAIRLPLRVEVRATLCPAHGQTRQRVLEGLFESEELQHPLVDARVEAHAALVRTDGVVELHTPGTIGADVALVVLPRHAKDHDAIGLCHALQDALSQIIRIAQDRRHDGFDDLSNRLVKDRLAWIAFLEALHEVLDRVAYPLVAGQQVHSRSSPLTQ